MAIDFNRLADLTRALKPTCQTGPSFHSSFVLKKGKIILIGTNTYVKGNSISHKYKRTRGDHMNRPFVAGIHSEQAVLGKLKFRERLDDLVLVNVRINNLNQLDQSCPCANCVNVLFKNPHRKFKKICYSTPNGFLEFPNE